MSSTEKGLPCGVQHVSPVYLGLGHEDETTSRSIVCYYQCTLIPAACRTEVGEVIKLCTFRSLYRALKCHDKEEY